MNNEQLIAAFYMVYPNLVHLVLALNRLGTMAVTQKGGGAALEELYYRCKAEIPRVLGAMRRNQRIVAAVLLLDPGDDDSWTVDGLPLGDKVRKILNGLPVDTEEIRQTMPFHYRWRAQVFRSEFHQHEDNFLRRALSGFSGSILHSQFSGEKV